MAKVALNESLTQRTTDGRSPARQMKELDSFLLRQVNLFRDFEWGITRQLRNIGLDVTIISQRLGRHHQ